MKKGLGPLQDLKGYNALHLPQLLHQGLLKVSAPLVMNIMITVKVADCFCKMLYHRAE